MTPDPRACALECVASPETRLDRCATGLRTRRRRGFARLYRTQCQLYIAVALPIYISQLQYGVADIHIAVAIIRSAVPIYISQLQYIKCSADIHIAVAIYKVRCRYTYRSCNIRESVDSLCTV